MVSILLADDHQIVRQDVSTLLANHTDLNIVAELSTGFEVMRWCAAEYVDIAVLFGECNSFIPKQHVFQRLPEEVRKLIGHREDNPHGDTGSLMD